MVLTLWAGAASAQWEAGGASRVYSAEELMGCESVLGASFSPDGRRILVTSDASGVLNAWAVPVDGGAREQLTRSTTAPVVALGYFPNDERFLFIRDGGGDERTHLYVRETDGTERDLTPGSGHRALFLGWAGDHKSFFVATNERDPRYFDIYEIAAAGYRRTLLFRNDGGYAVSGVFFRGACVSPDRRYLALTRVHSQADTDVYLYDLQRRHARLLTPYRDPVAHEPVAFTRDSRTLFMLTDRDHEFRYLVRVDVASYRRRTVEKPAWDVSGIFVSRSGRYAAIAVNRDGLTDMILYNAETGERAPLPRLPEGQPALVAFSRDDSAVAIHAQGGRTPGELYYGPLDADEPLRQLSRRLPPSVEPKDLVEPEVVRFKAPDGTRIPGILYKPHGTGRGARRPAVIYVHGGPGGQARVGFDPLFQLLANRGYVVFAVNARGSSGYGKTFLALDDGAHGRADLDDCVAARDYLVEAAGVDPGRVAILGDSYGGFLVYSALARRPEAFRAGIAVSAVADWIETLRGLPPWWEAEKAAYLAEVGDPETQREHLESLSPLKHADRIADPMLIIHGMNDARVAKEQAEAMAAAVRAGGGEVECLLFEGEGHSILRRANRIRMAEAVLGFLKEHLG